MLDTMDAPGRTDSGPRSRSYVVIGRLSKIKRTLYLCSILDLRSCTGGELFMSAGSLFFQRLHDMYLPTRASL